MDKNVRFGCSRASAFSTRLQLPTTTTKQHAMALKYRVGQRISLKGNRCTVRYIGKVEGTDQEKIWLGVEWDEPTRGKHNGEYLGRRYFQCKSSSPTVASFVNAKSARPDPERSFVEAIRQKYAAEPEGYSSMLDVPIIISTKEVQEVGFDKIRTRLAQLHELRIVLVDGLQVKKAEASEDSIERDCPMVVELDLSRNLFDGWGEIVSICKKLNHLQTLKLNMNRLEIRPEELRGAKEAFHGVYELELDNMALSWADIIHISQHFETLRTLTASSNGLRSLDYSLSDFPLTLFPSTLTSLTLEHNEFKSLSDLMGLKYLPSLKKLSLKGNEISEVFQRSEAESITQERSLVFTENLHYIDLSYNTIQDWGFVEALPDVFPGMTALRLSHNPINRSVTNEKTVMWSIEEAHMLTVARLGNLSTLNYGNITPTERTESEMYYLSQIAKAMAEVPENLEHIITSQHKRYAELCKIHGTPDVIRKTAQTVNPDFLEARLIKFTFYMPPNTKSGQQEVITKERELPKGLDIYGVKGVVGKMFDETPLSLRLVWETGTLDPVAGCDDLIDDNSDEDMETETEQQLHGKTDAMQLGRFVEREVEIEDSTRQVGNFVDGMEARVRVELR